MKRMLLPLLAAAFAAIAAPVLAEAAQSLAAAQARADAKDWAGAQALAAGGLAGDLIEWQRLRAGEGRLGDYEAFLARHPDWPGLPYLRAAGEAAVARSTTPERVIAYFDAGPPQTARGALALAAAHRARGAEAKAAAVMAAAWGDLSFSAAEETEALAAYGPALAPVHEARLEHLLWAGERAEAKRMIGRVGPGLAALAEARIALRSDAEGVMARIAAVPPALQDDPGLAYERFLYRMRHDSYDEAAALIVAQRDLGRPEAWADKRASLARWLMRNGKAKMAYRVAAGHGVADLSDRADLEFLAGFVALRQLGDPARALAHFRHLTEGGTPITKARGHYWMGRAQEAMGDAGARQSYQAAARFQSSYYGLLAAERLGLSLDPVLIARSLPGGDWRSGRMAASSVLAAARLLADAGNEQLSARFLLHLGESLDAAELGTLASMSLKAGEYRSALVLAKAAAERGVIFPEVYFPIPEMVPDQLKVSRALALAIARRESEFDPEARSLAGALGLMQVLPGTAKMVARDMGMDYAPKRLASDPAYNVQIGAAYLREMADRFGASIALIASGYNAGPRRPDAWIKAFGDPRSPAVDVVDWVETIPFTETRTYVMRVAEGVVIYRAKLKGVAGPVRITAELKGQ